MIETLLTGGRKAATPADSTDVNVDSKLVAISAGIAEYSSANLAMTGSAPTSTAAIVIGYWDGLLYIVKSDGVYKHDAGTLALVGKTTWAGRTIPLNTSSYLHKGVLYFGQGRGKTGIIEALDLRTGTYKQYPNLPYYYGAIYADDTYVYSIGNIYQSTGFSPNYIRRCKHDGTAWEDVLCSGTFAHGFSGADATLVGDEVWITGGGSVTAGTDTDGAQYTDVHKVNLSTLTISKVTIASPGMRNYDMASCLWKNLIYVVRPSASAVDRYSTTNSTATASTAGGTSVYHQPCRRVGDLFFYLAGYSSSTIYRYKLSLGL